MADKYLSKSSCWRTLAHAKYAILFALPALAPGALSAHPQVVTSNTTFQKLAQTQDGAFTECILINLSKETIQGFFYAFDPSENVFVALDVQVSQHRLTEYRWKYSPFQQFRLYPVVMAAGDTAKIQLTSPLPTVVKWVASPYLIPEHEPTLQNEIEGNYVELVICGMMFMMWLYVTLKFLQLRTPEYLFYSFTIFFSFAHFLTVLLAKVSVEWYSHPIEREFYHRLFQSFSHVAYFLFFRAFTNTSVEQPTFDRVLRWAGIAVVGYVAFDTIAVFGFRSAWPLETIWLCLRLGLVVFVITSLSVWVARSASPLRNYLIAGNLFLITGGVLTMIFNPYRHWVENWLPPFAYPLFYYRAGMLLEVICFSLGLGYKQKLSERKHVEAEQELQREQLELAKARELDAVKSAFFANISHEFRTPLTLIQAPADQIRIRGGDQFAKEVELIKNSSESLLRLINQVLELTKLETGQWRLQVEPVHLQPFFERVAAPFDYLAKQQNQRWQLRFSGPPGTGYIDADAFEKIVNNLAGNAIKHAGANAAITLDVQVELDHLLLRVSDTGRGIAADRLPFIFDRYYRGADGQSDGFGIGLAYTRELVRCHHGTIAATSPSGSGVTFHVRLPIAAHAYPAEEHKKIEKTTSLSTTVGSIPAIKPVLVLAEDHRELREFLIRLLSSAYEVLAVSNGAEAWEAIERDVPDLVLSDWMMPGLSGLELCERIKTTPATDHIPVVLLTARASDQARVEGWQTGADDYIVKPFDAQELQQRIQNLIQQRQRLIRKFGTATPVQNPPEQGPQEKFISNVRAAIEQHLDQSSFDVEQLARAVGFSRVQLHRKLTALVGQSPAEFVRNVRLDRAAYLLQHGQGNVSEVAWQTGFESQSHFARVYRERFGYPPSQTPRAAEKPSS